MKNTFFAFFIISLFSCSSNDENTDNNNLAATTYMNLTTNNFWKYRIETKNGTQATQVAPNLDHLKVGADEVIGGITFKKMEAEGTPTGFYTRTMDQKKLRKISDRIEFTGNISLDLGNGLGNGLPTQSIPVENFIIFKESAVNNTTLSSKTGTLAPIPVTLPINGSNVNVNLLVDYIFTSVSGQTLPTFTPPIPNSGTAATTYTDVKEVLLILNLKVMAQYNLGGFPITIPVLNPQPQNVIVSTSYYAKNKGVVFTQTNTNFTFANTPNSTTPISAPVTILQREYLDSFTNN